MTHALQHFAITRKWPARHPDRLQLYSLPTPNGVKASIMLEETGLPYEAHRVGFDTQDQLSPEFLSLNPNNKIPAIIDPHGPGGQPLALFESGAILIYLADKTGQLLPPDPAARYGKGRTASEPPSCPVPSSRSPRPWPPCPTGAAPTIRARPWPAPCGSPTSTPPSAS